MIRLAAIVVAVAAALLGGCHTTIVAPTPPPSPHPFDRLGGPVGAGRHDTRPLPTGDDR